VYPLDHGVIFSGSSGRDSAGLILAAVTEKVWAIESGPEFLFNIKD
jgi:hypothetical protein